MAVIASLPAVTVHPERVASPVIASIAAGPPAVAVMVVGAATERLWRKPLWRFAATALASIC